MFTSRLTSAGSSMTVTYGSAFVWLRGEDKPRQASQSHTLAGRVKAGCGAVCAVDVL